MLKYYLKKLSPLLLFVLVLSSCQHHSHQVSTLHQDDTVLEGHVISSHPVVIKTGHSENSRLSSALLITDGPLSAGLIENVLKRKDKKNTTADGINYSIKIRNSNISDNCSYSPLICKALSSAKNSRIINVVKDQNTKIELGKKVYVVLSGKHAHLLHE
jgi:hypothetical protein